MKKLILSVCMLMSVNAFAIDLSNDQVADPVKDSEQITAEIGARGAILLSPVTCTHSGSATDFFLTCGVQRRVVSPESDARDENFGCMMEYSLNQNGQGYTRTSWECPIL